MARLRLGLVRVRGISMEPTLCEGQLLIVRYAAQPHPGALVVVQLPPEAAGQPRPLSVKRLTHFEPDGRAWVEADNQRAPGRVDSWAVGALDPTAVVAVVTARLRSPRRGWFRSVSRRRRRD